MLRIVSYTTEIRNFVAGAIDKFGYAPEHNIYWFECSGLKGQTPYYAHIYGSDEGILAFKEPGAWYTLSDPVAPRERAAGLINMFTRQVFTDPTVKKIVIECDAKTKKQLKFLLAPEYRIGSIHYTLIWPVTVMSNFDPTLPGKKWKSIRNARNAFYRNHKVQVIPIHNVSQEDLHGVIKRWKEGRGRDIGSQRDLAYPEPFYAMVDAHFSGCDEARAMIVDGRVVGFNAGWVIPHSDTYYGAIGVHDYSIKDLGQVLYLEDLLWIKNRGYVKADMAGGEKILTAFKNQFHPDEWYKTHVFSILRDKTF